MLRITVTESGCYRHVRLEGKLVGPWVDEVRATCTGPDGLLALTRINLAGVTYIDDQGAALITELTRGGASVGPCSGYIHEYLKGANP